MKELSEKIKRKIELKLKLNKRGVEFRSTVNYVLNI